MYVCGQISGTCMSVILNDMFVIRYEDWGVCVCSAICLSVQTVSKSAKSYITRVRTNEPVTGQQKAALPV